MGICAGKSERISKAPVYTANIDPPRQSPKQQGGATPSAASTAVPSDRDSIVTGTTVTTPSSAAKKKLKTSSSDTSVHRSTNGSTASTRAASGNASAASRGTQPSQTKSHKNRPPEKPGVTMPPNPVPYPELGAAAPNSNNLPGIPVIDTSAMDDITRGFFPPESPKGAALAKEPVIRNLTPTEIERGEGVMEKKPSFQDADGDLADEFIICDTL